MGQLSFSEIVVLLQAGQKVSPVLEVSLKTSFLSRNRTPHFDPEGHVLFRKVLWQLMDLNEEFLSVEVTGGKNFLAWETQNKENAVFFSLGYYSAFILDMGF